MSVPTVHRQHLSVIFGYTLLSLVAGVIVGLILGILRRLLGDGADHQWGTWDFALVLRLFGTFAVCFAIYWRLARKHPHRFLANGMAIGALTGALSFASSLIYALKVQLTALAASVASHIIIFLVAAAILRLFFRMPAPTHHLRC